MSQPASTPTTIKNKKTGSCIMIALLAFTALTVVSIIYSGLSNLGRATGLLPTNTPTALSSPTTLVILPTQTTAPATATALNPTQTSAPIIDPTATPQAIATIAAVSPADSCVPAYTPQTGQVVEVVDGDTIKVQINGSVSSVRYIGVDTPESTIQHEPFGKEASQKNSELVAGQIVTLYRDRSNTDKYDRLLRYVFVGQTFINRELVVTGYAEAKDYPPDTACSETFHTAQLEAQTALLGMWAASAQPTAPVASAPGGSLKIIQVNKQAEYVVIKNDSPTQIDISGWILLSEKGSQSCPLAGIIEPGATLQIWSQTGTGFSCNFSTTIWNNSESDPAVLINPQGQEISRY